MRFADIHISVVPAAVEQVLVSPVDISACRFQLSGQSQGVLSG